MSPSQQLQKIILKSGLSRYEICKRAGVQQSALSLFLSGKRGLTTETLDKLAPILGLTITAKPKPPRKGK